jgi:hypothetical protein
MIFEQAGGRRHIKYAGAPQALWREHFPDVRLQRTT